MTGPLSSPSENIVGYSGKPVWQKLGIMKGMLVGTVRAPANYRTLVVGAPAYTVVTNIVSRDLDMIQLFVTKLDDLFEDVQKYPDHLRQGGILWISWPKKLSGVKTDISEQNLRDVLLPLGWVDTKVCAISDIWSGLKFLRRKTPSTPL